MEVSYQPIHYVNARQQLTMLGGNTIIARGTGPANALLPGLRAALRDVDPQARGITRTVDEMVQDVTLERRRSAGVLAGFAALALILAGIGIYGVLAYSVAQRLREIGIRMALGASAGRVVRGTLADLGVPVVAGIIVGLVAARAASGVFTALVFGIKPSDPFVLGSAVAVIVMLALLAAYVPARRAARVDPTPGAAGRLGRSGWRDPVSPTRNPIPVSARVQDSQAVPPPHRRRIRPRRMMFGL